MTVHDVALLVEGVSKRFGGVQALDGVSLEVRRGEVCAVVGENGAGKTTLMNVVGGVMAPDAGRVLVRGAEVHLRSPAEAARAGIAVIHQELAMFPSLDIMENIFVGRMPSRFGLARSGEIRARTRELLSQVGLEADPSTRVGDLGISERQLVEIARALSFDASIIIMDEPNSSLSQAESERLFSVIVRLKASGVAILYVSHKIDEVLRLADRITVLRDGRAVGCLDRAEATSRAIIFLMVNREVERTERVDGSAPGAALLEVRNLSGRGFHGVGFHVRSGEIVGLAGLVGAGRSEVARAIFGADPIAGGEVVLNGRVVRFRSPEDAIRAGVAMVPEDRKLLSLFMEMSVLANTTLAELPRLQRLGFVKRRKERETAADMTRRLSVRAPGLGAPVRTLSGGNQQKTVLARWLMTRPKLLILDEPTHGVDIGAKAEIYKVVRDLARDGVGVLLLSSELPEILAMSDRVIVMHEGRVTGAFGKSEATEQAVMVCAAGAGEATQ